MISLNTLFFSQHVTLAQCTTDSDAKHGLQYSSLFRTVQSIPNHIRTKDGTAPKNLILTSLWGDRWKTTATSSGKARNRICIAWGVSEVGFNSFKTS